MDAIVLSRLAQFQCDKKKTPHNTSLDLVRNDKNPLNVQHLILHGMVCLVSFKSIFSHNSKNIKHDVRDMTFMNLLYTGTSQVALKSSLVDRMQVLLLWKLIKLCLQSN